jgi:serine/threonine protein kinase/Tol biopolymer transport system component
VEKRATLLDELCSGDTELRCEVEVLLGSENGARDDVRAAIHGGLHAITFPLVGETVSHYRILDGLGGGGMGLVYKAEDIKLGRLVALKFLPEESARNPEALNRFEREARSASTLEHSNICPIYEFGEHEGQTFLVMQLLEGQTLRELIPESDKAKLPLELPKLLDIALQIVDALEVAHHHGIIHRDIKPANIFVTTKGQVKLLDFGLAKLSHVDAGDEEGRQLPCDAAGRNGGKESALATAPPDRFLSRTGVAMGTAGYMSPEQERGEKLDARTDLFSFGLVLYEMATGQRAFKGDTGSGLHQAIRKQTPAPQKQLNPRLPSKLEAIIGKTLEKDRNLRYQSASELRADLQAVRESLTPSNPNVPVDVKMGGTRAVPWQLLMASGLLACLLAIGVGAYWSRRTLAPTILGFTQLTRDNRDKSNSINPYIPSPLVTDGARLYFMERGPSGHALMQAPTAGGEAAVLATPYRIPHLLDISPSKSELLIAGFVGTEPEAPLVGLPVVGGPPRALGQIFAHDGTWSSDGRSLIYASGDKLYLARTEKAGAIVLASVPRGVPWWPRLSPNGTALRFTVLNPADNSTSLWQVSVDGTHLHPLLPGWHDPPAECCGSWTADGRYYIFQSSSSGNTQLWALRESRNLFNETRSEPIPLTTGQMSTLAPLPDTSGRKIFAIGVLNHGQLARYDERLRQFVPYLSGISAEGLSFSKNGEWMTYIEYPEGTLWRSKLDGSDQLQLTFSPMRVLLPRWSPSGSQIAFAAAFPGKPWSIYIVAKDGGPPAQVTDGSCNEGDVGWSPDGGSVVFGCLGHFAGPRTPISVLNLGTRRTTMLRQSEGLFSPRWSPNGRYIAAISVNSQKLMLFDWNTQSWKQLLAADVAYPNWSRDGKYIYFDSQTQDAQVYYRLQVDNRTVVQRAKLEGLGRASGLFGPWFGLGPDDSMLVLLNIGTQEIYSMDLKLP